MGLGSMNIPITILETKMVKDKDGFVSPADVPVASVRAYKEDKNTTEKWTNRAIFQQASALFRFRYIPRTVITTDMKIECADGKYNIMSVENIKGRNMYIEVLAKKEVVPNGAGNNEIP